MSDIIENTIEQNIEHIVPGVEGQRFYYSILCEYEIPRTINAETGAGFPDLEFEVLNYRAWTHKIYTNAPKATLYNKELIEKYFPNPWDKGRLIRVNLVVKED